MKLTLGTRNGFALPSILLVSTVMLAILIASVGAASSSRVALDSQYYNQLASQAAESGVNRANECLSFSGYVPQWSTKAASKDLRPDSDCTGTSVFSSPYVLGTATSKVRTSYSIEAPSGSGVGSSLKVVGAAELIRASSPNGVWRRYEQVTYLRIEPPPATSCPAGFASVPGSVTYGTSDFCIAKYEAKNVGGRAASQAAGMPYINITQTDASTAASRACTGCHLVTEAEWLTVATNALGVASNWTGGAVGSGSIYSGHNDFSPANGLAASTDDTDGYNGTGNTSPSTQRRTLALSNGEIIWDFAGNYWEWTAGLLNGGQPGASGYAWREWNAIGGTGSMSPNPFPSFGTSAASAWTSATGIGSVYSDSSQAALRGIVRGGSWGSFSNHSGVFAASLDRLPGTPYSDVGFRIAK